MDTLYREFQIDPDVSKDWIIESVDHLFGKTWRSQIYIDEEDEENISYDMIKRIFINWMNQYHPIKSKSEKNYSRLLDEYIQKKDKWIQLSRSIVFDEWMKRRVRRMKRSGEKMHFHLTEMEKGDIQERLDQIEETMNDMDRHFMRDYSSKEQMDYFNEIFTRQVSKKKVEVKNPFDSFYVNPTSHISDTYESFDQNDRFKKEDEIDYSLLTQKREAVIERPDGITMENFNEMFEKQRHNDQMSHKTGLDAFFQVEPVIGTSSAFTSNRPMTKEDMDQNIHQHLAASELERKS
jgi:hypothetical protein